MLRTKDGRWQQNRNYSNELLTQLEAATPTENFKNTFLYYIRSFRLRLHSRFLIINASAKHQDIESYLNKHSDLRRSDSQFFNSSSGNISIINLNKTDEIIFHRCGGVSTRTLPQYRNIKTSSIL